VGEPSGDKDELIVNGIIQKYRAGSRRTRLFFPGFGSSSFEGELILLDGSSKEQLLRAPFDKLWGWGGMLGASKDIRDMVDEVAASVASTVARAKGWNPSRR
jgi:hypothetical protein